jgi:AhpD family alkylhydroperoxidase|tara:strand:+ start:459 stop:800 length:342 start_codon:yes stop_codon:yes gene_type:complete
MAKDYTKMVPDISAYLAEFGKEKPEAMQGFVNLSKAANSPSVLDEKTKELIALAIGVSQRCDGCIAFHVKKLVELGATRQELADMLAVATYMGGGPTLMYAADCLRAYDQFTK